MYMCMAQDGKTALMCASANDHATMVNLLVEAGANLEVQDKVRVCTYATYSPT